MSTDNNQKYTYSICIDPKNSYDIAYYDEAGNGWSSDSYLRVAYQGETFYKGTLNGNANFKSDPFSFSECSSNEIRADIKRVYTAAAEEESFNIYEGESSSGTLLLSVQGTSSNNYYTLYSQICIIPDQIYYIEYSDSVSSSSSANYGWSSGSYVEISYQDNVFVKGAVPSGYNHRIC